MLTQIAAQVREAKAEATALELRIAAGEVGTPEEKNRALAAALRLKDEANRLGRLIEELGVGTER